MFKVTESQEDQKTMIENIDSPVCGAFFVFRDTPTSHNVNAMRKLVNYTINTIVQNVQEVCSERVICLYVVCTACTDCECHTLRDFLFERE